MAIGPDHSAVVSIGQVHDRAQHPVRSVEAMGETDSDGGKTCTSQSFCQRAWVEDPDVAARALEVFVPEPEIEVFACRGRNGDR